LNLNNYKESAANLEGAKWILIKKPLKTSFANGVTILKATRGKVYKTSDKGTLIVSPVLRFFYFAQAVVLLSSPLVLFIVLFAIKI